MDGLGIALFFVCVIQVVLIFSILKISDNTKTLDSRLSKITELLEKIIKNQNK